MPMQHETSRVEGEPVPTAVTARGWFDYRHMFGLAESALAHHRYWTARPGRLPSVPKPDPEAAQ